MNKYLQKVTILLMISFSGYVIAENGHEFDSLVVFGDSLSDVGNYMSYMDKEI